MAEPRDLVDRARLGDRDARGELVGHQLPGLRAFVRSRLGRVLRRREESADIAQSVVREALEDLERFEYRGGESFRKWLFLRAENKIKDRGRFWRRERRSPAREVELMPEGREASDSSRGATPACEATPSRVASAREDLSRIERALTRLPEDYRRVVVLARFAGLSHDEIAREIGRTSAATRTLLCRAMARLAVELEQR